MTQYREKLNIHGLSLDKLADSLYGASREIIDEENRPMFTNQLGKKLSYMSLYDYQLISCALVKHAAEFSEKHGLYLIEAHDAIIMVYNNYDELRGSKPDSGSPSLQKISGNMSLLYRTKEELKRFIEERVNIEIIRVATFKL